MDYPVPHFGQDHDILTTWNSLDVAEALKQHRWNLAHDWDKKPDDPIKYNFNMDLDDDIEMTHEHLNEAEKKLKHKWEYKAVQLDSDEQLYTDSEFQELMRQHKQVNPAVYTNPIALAKLTSDPIFGSADVPLPEHDMASEGKKIVVYPDPDEQGLDEDILNTHTNLASSQKYWKHNWAYNTSAGMPNFAIPGKQ